MPRRARIHLVSLRSSLVNLPLSLYGPLLERNIRPQRLAVHLTLVPPHNALTASPTSVEAYVGWTGMASTSSLSQLGSTNSSQETYESLEMDPQYAAGLGFQQGSIVEVGLLHDLTAADSVATEPVSSDDWEIIELHASHIESTLLSQVRVAKVGQEINVWVLGRTRVRLRVVKTRLPCSLRIPEVSVAPKLHQSSSGKSAPLKRNELASPPEPSDQVNSLPPSAPSSHWLRVLPSHVLPQPLPLPPSAHLLGYISAATWGLLSDSKASLEPSQYQQVKVVKYPAPLDPLDTTENVASPLAKVLNPGADDVTEKPATSIFVAVHGSVPNGQIVFPQLGEGIANWDRLRQDASFLAGVDDILKSCEDYCRHAFSQQARSSITLGVTGILVTGRAGAGKTSIVQAVCDKISLDTRTLTYTMYVDASRYTEKPISVVKSLLDYWIHKALWHRPSVIVLDNLDKLVPAELEHADSFRSRHVAELFLALFSSSARFAPINFRGVIMIATASSTAALHHLINSSHIFSHVVQVKPPNKESRKEILEKLTLQRITSSNGLALDPNTALNFTTLSTQTEGYLAADLKDLVSRAVHQVAMHKAKNLEEECYLNYAAFQAAQKDFVPASLRDVKLQASDVVWADIGGLKETKRILRETLEWPTKYAQIFAQSPLRLRSGLLLYGFPGCGKTLLASAVAQECGLNFISVKGPEILNKYIGASEKSVRDLFERASAAKPCVLFFDEFDSIAPKRGHDSTGVTDRVVNQMLTQMDGAEGLEGVYVLAATSRPDLIDSALLRPGRLDKSIFCNMPDIEEREEILRAVSRKVTMDPDISLAEIAKETEGFSGADLQSLIYNAQLQIIHNTLASTDSVLERESDRLEPSLGLHCVATKAENAALEQRLRQIQLNSNKARSSRPAAKAITRNQRQPTINDEVLAQALASARPSVSSLERHRLERIYEAFLAERSGELPVPPGESQVGTRSSLM
ncbi:P-loop containing nucleoside triphosphate hydrolase protein [Flagelloscypha sp. PMI_526]|nr:P-loop containing nucleoside triphosphate hydrolase protein [Flagelloscypha sp. PMI_526]